MNFAKSADTDRLAEVNVTGNGCGTDVEPVRVVGSEFFERGCFDDINPGGDLELAYTILVSSRLKMDGRDMHTGSFQELRVCFVKYMRVNVPHTCASSH